MSLTGDKVGIPEAEEAPVIVVPRWKQPIAGIIGILLTFVLSIAVWYALALAGLGSLISLLGGFGLMAVLFAIWFENWPFYKLKKPWKVGLAATILNIIVAFVFVIITTVFSVGYGTMLGISDPLVQQAVGSAIFGALSASCFSFAVLWVAGTMYWPWFDKKQPKRGILVFIVGWIITLVAWLLLFFPYGNPAATLADPLSWVLPQYGLNMGWTQWIIFFALLTLMAFEYWPWNKAGKQPKIGIAAFITCIVLGLVFLVVAGIVGAVVTYPLMLLLGFPDPGIAQAMIAIGLWNVAFADWLIIAIIFVSLFFDNWPKGYSQKKNFLIRFLTIVIIGTILFFASYLIAPILGPIYTGNPFYDNLTPFLLMFLWVQLVFAYLWRKWPIYKEM